MFNRERTPVTDIPLVLPGQPEEIDRISPRGDVLVVRDAMSSWGAGRLDFFEFPLTKNALPVLRFSVAPAAKLYGKTVMQHQCVISHDRTRIAWLFTLRDTPKSALPAWLPIPRPRFVDHSAYSIWVSNLEGSGMRHDRMHLIVLTELS